MIKLIDILNEVQYAPLYHATTVPRLLSIVNDEVIKPNELGYIFLTRDKNYKVGGQSTPIVFKIDQEKIRQRYKIFPRVGDIANQNKRIEAEEVVKGQIPLDWVQEIQIPQSIVNKLEEVLQNAKKGLEWAKEKNPKAIKSYSDMIEQYTKVLNYPKLSII